MTSERDYDQSFRPGISWWPLHINRLLIIRESIEQISQTVTRNAFDKGINPIKSVRLIDTDYKWIFNIKHIF